MRVIFDTNVTVSAALFDASVSGRAFLEALRNQEILVSLATLKELNDVLGRPRFANFITSEEREEFLEALLE